MTTDYGSNKPRPSPVALGSVVAGKYRVDRVIGSGGMGVVVVATHTVLARKVAIKFLLATALVDDRLVARFSREARTTTMIQSEHVVKILDVGTLDTGAPFIVMEHLEGADLSQVLRDRGPLPVPEVIEYVLQACEAIAEAHVRGIVHRDLKPANLFLSRRADGSPCLKVLDFGVSKLTADDDSRSGNGEVTQTEAVVGSPAYMAPEQIRSARMVDARADIWALGAVLHKLLTGRGAFAASSTADITVKVLTEASPRLRTIRPDIPQGVDDAVARCLEKDPAARFQNVAELARALCTFGPRRALASANRIARVLGAADNLLDSEVPPPAGPPAPIFGATWNPPYASTDAASSTSALGGHATTTTPSTRRLPRVLMLAVMLAAAVAILVGLVVIANARLYKRAAARGNASAPKPLGPSAFVTTEPHSPEPAARDGAIPAPPPSPSPSPSFSFSSPPSAVPSAAEPRPRHLPNAATGAVPGRPPAGYNDGEFGGRK